MRARPFIATGLFRVDGAPATSNQYVFAWDGVTDGDLYAYFYADGEYVSTRGTQSITGDCDFEERWNLIHSDSSGLVGDGALFTGSSGVIRVWDVDGGVLYTHTPAGAFFVGMAYHSGKLYWVESDGVANFDVWQSDTDLNNRSSVATIVHGLGAGAGIQSVGQNSAALFFEALDSGLTTRKRFRVAFSGFGATSADISGETNYAASLGHVRADNKMVFLNNDARLCVLDSDAAGATVSEVWPDFGLGYTGPQNFSVNAAGSQAQFLGSAGLDGFRDATSGSFGGAHADSFTLEESPDGVLTGGSVAAFYYGD